MVISKVYSDARRSRRVCKKMKRLLNVLGALVSDLTQNELAARGACLEELCLGRDLEPRCDIVDVTPWRPHDW